LLTFGAGSAGAYYYLENSTPKTPPKPTKSSLDPENFKNFKLKKIKPYNHNTSEFVLQSPDPPFSYHGVPLQIRV
jgi:cytochrome-b5 reductase